MQHEHGSCNCKCRIIANTSRKNWNPSSIILTQPPNVTHSAIANSENNEREYLVEEETLSVLYYSFCLLLIVSGSGDMVLRV